MKENNTALSQRADYSPPAFTRFLWWLATAEEELVADAVVDRNRYQIVGMTVLATWMFATLAWSYFFSTVTGNLAVSLALGLFMGWIILTIDRALIKGINRYNKNWFLPVLFRGMLAITIGIFMAQPALLYMFRKEIILQTSLDNEQKKQLKKQQLDSLYKKSKLELQAQKQKLEAENNSKYNDVTHARNNYLAESDGSGGTGRVGIKEIAIAKKTEYQKLDGEYQQLLKTNQPKIDEVDRQLNAINSTISKAELEFTAHFNNGFLTQIAALNNLIKDNSALASRYYLLVMILLLIELMPVIAKTLLPAGTYDEKLRLREEMEKEIARSNIRKEHDIKERYNELAMQNDTDAITAFFELTREDRKEKMSSFSKKWKEDNHQSFDGLWEKMKKQLLTRQEN